MDAKGWIEVINTIGGWLLFFVLLAWFAGFFDKD